MLNRRLIRIKVFKVLYSTVSSGSNSLKEAEKELIYSCNKTRDLYYFMLNIATALQNVAQAKIDAGLQKYHPSNEELYPNRKFADNQLSARLASDPNFVRYCQKNGLQWVDESQVFVKKLFATISEREYFKAYMEAQGRSFKEDCNLFIKIFQEEFEDNEEIAQLLEDFNLYWMDDLAYALITIIRNIEMYRDKNRIVHPETFLKEDDKEYAVELLNFAIIHYNDYLEIVTKNVSNWDSDRMVATDITLIILGIAEAVHFQSIPIKVTINEYVEISKFYSTINSKVFVNGLLDKIIQQMVKDGTIVKTGRGLIES